MVDGNALSLCSLTHTTVQSPWASKGSLSFLMEANL